ncbi:MAG: Holliday junction resolvase RuvX, partial [Dehalococcoidia bacterium]|nr:Holliday junction resolvase RuvX [Dehalococcoidia bacterium]
MGRIMGLDIGDKRIGIAVSDPSLILASPLKTLERKDDASTVLEIEALLRQYDIGRLVIGLPYLLDGTVGEQARKVMEFVARITEQIGVETVMQDERLTSVTADRMLREAG